MIADPDPHRHVRGYAEIVAEIAGRVEGLYDAARVAAAADPEAAELWSWMQGQRGLGARNFVRQSSEKGRLREGLDEEAAADIVFVLADPGVYRTLVLERGWPVERYREWLVRSLQEQLLAPRDGSPE